MLNTDLKILWEGKHLQSYRGSDPQEEPLVIQSQQRQCCWPGDDACDDAEEWGGESDPTQLPSIVTCVVFLGCVLHYARYYMDIKQQFLPLGNLYFLSVWSHLCAS